MLCFYLLFFLFYLRKHLLDFNPSCVYIYICICRYVYISGETVPGDVLQSRGALVVHRVKKGLGWRTGEGQKPVALRRGAGPGLPRPGGFLLDRRRGCPASRFLLADTALLPLSVSRCSSPAGLGLAECGRTVLVPLGVSPLF